MIAPSVEGAVLIKRRLTLAQESKGSVLNLNIVDRGKTSLVVNRPYEERLWLLWKHSVPSVEAVRS